jgi:hypothetical protein
MTPHIVVVGGTGMLWGMVEALAGDGGRLSLLSRRAGARSGGSVTGYDCDHHDEAAFTEARWWAPWNPGPQGLERASDRSRSVTPLALGRLR